MTPQQWKIAAVVSVALALVVGSIVVIASSGGDDDSVRTASSTSSSSSTSALPTTTSTLPPLTSPPIVTPSTITPGSTVIIPGSTTTVPPTTQPPTTTQASTTTTAPTTTTTEPDGSTDIGITPTEIHLAVIADDPATFDGMEAWASTANRGDGIAGRKVRLDLLTTNGTAEGYAAAVQTACDQDFAIVGSFSLFDVASDVAGCADIPDLPVEATNVPHSVTPNVFAAFPREPAVEAVGALRWLAENVGGCCVQYWVVPDADPLRTRTLATIDAAAAAGFTTGGSTDLAVDAPTSDYDAVVSQIAEAGASFAASGWGLDSTVTLRRAAVAGDLQTVDTWYCDGACYETRFLDQGGGDVEGQYVAIETAAFTDRSEVPGVRAYLRSTRRGDDDPSYAGLRSFTAGLLFEQALDKVVDDAGKNGITRVRLLEQLATIDAFTGNGIVGPTDVAGGVPNGCYVLLRVVDGKFVRQQPPEVGSLDCGPQNLQTIGD